MDSLEIALVACIVSVAWLIVGACGLTGAREQVDALPGKNCRAFVILSALGPLSWLCMLIVMLGDVLVRALAWFATAMIALERRK